MREKITIRRLPDAPYEAAADFYSILAYPDKSSLKARSRFRDALCIFAIVLKANADPTWAAERPRIRPSLLALESAKGDAALKAGFKKLRERFAASFLVAPHWIGPDWSPLQGYDLTVGNLSIYAQKSLLGWAGDDPSTFKAKVWKPSQPVAHAVLALLLCSLTALEYTDGIPEGGIPMVVEELFSYERLFFDEEFLADVIDQAEVIRAGMTKITQFEIREENTIQFRLSDCSDVQLPNESEN